ncbi:MAG TPA: 5-dehydro-2-deoxygluconokinase [Capillimicrobium sp.]|jgi:5-dehydro-2-deoxygluconokinase
MRAPEVVTMGRIGVDLYPEQHGVPLADVRTFRKALGGSPTNVAVAAARLGRRAAVVTKVGDDAFGAFCRTALEGFGVDTRWVGAAAQLRTPLAFCEIHPPDHFPLLFYREPTAPDLCLDRADLDLPALASAPVLWTTGTGLSREPSRAATLAAMDARDPDGWTVHDLDARPMLWERPADHGPFAVEAVRRASVVVGNTAEAAVAVGDGSALKQARALLALGPRLAIVKRGPQGTLAVTADEVVDLAAAPTRVVNGLGAGDAFGGALCHGLLAGWGLDRLIRFANAAGAIVAGRLLCADDMPSEREILHILDTEDAP